MNSICSTLNMAPTRRKNKIGKKPLPPAKMEKENSAKAKKFAVDMDKALKAFETSTEWADLIACLQKLNKYLESYMKSCWTMPNSVVLSRRVAQCLNPKLPSGVHLMALKTCQLIFLFVGESQLAEQLHLYSIGLFPLFGLASIKVRTEMLKIFDEHLIPLGLSLQPAVPALLTGVFPALEEGTDFFERTNSFLEKVQKSVGDEYFFECLWNCVLYSPSVRYPALVYVINHVDKSKPMEDQLFVMGFNNGSLMVCAMCCAAEDSMQLVQRNLLEYVTTAFPLHSEYLNRDDLSRLVQSCMMVVLKRDMSLNRRLFSWFFGHPVSPSAQPNLEYFNKNALPLIEDAVKKTLEGGEGEEVAHICRLFMHLLDREELGPSVVNKCLFPLLVHSMNTYPAKGIAKEEQNSSCKMVNLLLTNSLDVAYLWNYLGQYVDNALSGKVVHFSTVKTVCSVVNWILDVVQLDAHTDIRTKHIPELLLLCLKTLCAKFDTISKSEKAFETITETVKMLHRLLEPIVSCNLFSQNTAENNDASLNESSFLEGSPTSFQTTVVGSEGQKIVSRCIRSYEKFVGQVFELVLYQPSSIQATRTMVKVCCQLLTNLADFPLYCAPDDLKIVMNKQPSTLNKEYKVAPWLYYLEKLSLGGWKKGVYNDCQCQFDALNALLHAFIVSQSVVHQYNDYVNANEKDKNGDTDDEHTSVLLRPMLSVSDLEHFEKQQMFSKAASDLWSRLDYEHCREHDQVTQLFLLVHSVYPGVSSPCEDICVNHFTANNQDMRLEAMRKFQLIWSLNRGCIKDDICPGVPYKPFNRCLVTVLDILSTCKEQYDPVFEAARCWLVDCVHEKDIPQLVTLLCSLLLHPCASRISIQYVNLDDPPPLTHPLHQLVALRTKAAAPLYHINDLKPCGEMKSHDDAAHFLELRHELMLQNKAQPPRQTTHDESPVREGLRFDEEEPVEVTVNSIVQCMVDLVCREVDEEKKQEEIKFVKPPNGVVLVRPSKLEHSGDDEQSSADSSPDQSHVKSPELDYELDDRLCMHLVEGVVEMGTEMEAEKRSSVSPLSPSLSTQLDLSGSDMHHPFHAHMLLYLQGHNVDLTRPTQTMHSLAQVLSVNGGDLSRQIVDAMARNGTNSTPRSEQNNRLVHWMAAHLRTITGKCFWSPDGEETVQKHYMLLELLITVCLYYIRSYHLNNPCFPVTRKDLQNNLKAKLAAIQLVQLLLQNLTTLVYSRDFASFVADLLSKCRLQKTLLHCVMATLKTEQSTSQPSAPFSVSVHEFNHERDMNSLALAFQSRLLDTMVVVFELELKINQSITAEATANASGIYVEKLSVAQQLPSLQNVPLVDSSLFIITTLNALKKHPSNHPVWLRMICRSLPYMGRSLGDLCQHVCHQLCQNAEDVVNASFQPMADVSRLVGSDYPTNYLCTVLDSLTVIVHHCLLSSAVVEVPVNVGSSVPIAQSSISNVASSVKEGTSLVLTNLIRAFTFAEANQVEGSPIKGDKPFADGLGKAKSTLLNLFPHILSPLCRLWSILKDNKQPLFPIGSPQHARKVILDLLSPIVINHPSHFLSALATVWLTKKSLDPSCSPTGYSSEQMNIADLLMNLKLLRFESLTLAVAHTLKDPAKITMVRDRDVFPIGLSLLELLDGCLQCTHVQLLTQSWMSLYQLLMQVLAKAEDNARVCFLLFRIYCNYVLMCCSERLPTDPNAVKCMQEACAKLTEAVISVIGWQLEPNNWLFKGSTLVVKTSPSFVVLDEEESWMADGRRSPVPSEVSVSSSRKEKIIKDTNNNRKNASLSTEAMQLLEQNLARVFDCVFKSDDKDKFTATLLSLWSKITPFFKTRTCNDAANFTSCSGLLASLSKYSSTRSVWRKGATDILCEATFFRMNLTSSKHWLLIIDNLMTNDKNTFPDLLKRISPTQSAGLFTSREMEYEMRALSLKRLTFTLLSSETDQYYMYLHDVRERVTENLKLYQVAPHVHAQVFVCFRTLLISMSPQYLAKMWPAIITELIQVLQTIENKLVGTSEADYKSARDDQWMQLYLSAIKLLIAFFLVPAEYLTSFQMYSWSFCYSVPITNTNAHFHVFTPLLQRIVDLLETHSRENCKKHPDSTAEQTCQCKMESVSSENLLQLMNFKQIASIESMSPYLQLLSDRNIPVVDKNQAFQLIKQSVLVDLTDEFTT